MTIVKCNVCNQKKAQRNCPALKQLICPTCCGEHREKVQDCPQDCIYLIESQKFKDEKYREEMIIKTDRVKRDILNGEEKYNAFIEEIEDIVYKKVSTDEHFEDGHIVEAVGELAENYMSRNVKIIESEKDIKLNRAGTLKSDLQDFLKRIRSDEEKAFENHEIAGCLDMFKMMVELQGESSVEEDKRAFINSLIASKKEKEASAEGEAEDSHPPSEGETSESTEGTEENE